MKKIAPVGRKKTILAWVLVFALCAIVVGLSFFLESKGVGLLASASNIGPPWEPSSFPVSSGTSGGTQGGTTGTTGPTGPNSTACQQANSDINSQIDQEIARVRQGVSNGTYSQSSATDTIMRLTAAKNSSDPVIKQQMLTNATAGLSREFLDNYDQWSKNSASMCISNKINCEYIITTVNEQIDQEYQRIVRLQGGGNTTEVSYKLFDAKKTTDLSQKNQILKDLSNSGKTDKTLNIFLSAWLEVLPKCINATETLIKTPQLGFTIVPLDENSDLFRIVPIDDSLFTVVPIGEEQESGQSTTARQITVNQGNLWDYLKNLGLKTTHSFLPSYIVPEAFFDVGANSPFGAGAQAGAGGGGQGRGARTFASPYGNAYDAIRASQMLQQDQRQRRANDLARSLTLIDLGKNLINSVVDLFTNDEKAKDNVSSFLDNLSDAAANALKIGYLDVLVPQYTGSYDYGYSPSGPSYGNFGFGSLGDFLPGISGPMGLAQMFGTTPLQQALSTLAGGNNGNLQIVAVPYNNNTLMIFATGFGDSLRNNIQPLILHLAPGGNAYYSLYDARRWLDQISQATQQQSATGTSSTSSE